MIKYIDIHSHLPFKEFDSDRESVLEEMKEKGIATIAIGTDYEESKKAIEIAEKHADIFASVGIHPADNRAEKFEYEKFLKLAKHQKVVAIGECGIDYFYIDEKIKKEIKDSQQEMFREHVRLAVEVDKPLMLHIRPSKGMDAYDGAIEILKKKKEKYGEKVRGNFHFFVGDVATAKKVLDIGFTVSFSGVITFAKEYEEVVRFVPLDKMHAETDSPYVAPAPERGKRNSPVYVTHIVEKIAEIKVLPVEEVREQLLKNAEKMFGIVLGA